jgi:geranylgeranyl diphosphate synthase type II
LRIGAVIAGADAGKLAAVDRFGQKLGLAFQIIDDLLDIKGSAHWLGKSVGKDAQQSKLTFPAILGEEPSRRRAAELIRDAQAALQPLAADCGYLNSLACYVLERSR